MDIILELIFMNSFLFSIATPFLAFISSPVHLFFIALILIGSLVYRLKKLAYVALFAILLIFVFFMPTTSTKAFVVYILILNVIYQFKVLGQFESSAYVMVVMIGIICVLFVNAFNIANLVDSNISLDLPIYVPLYIVGSFLFLRSARYRGGSGEKKLLLKENALYLGSLIVIYLITIIEFIRNFFLNTIQSISHFFMSHLTRGIQHVIDWLFTSDVVVDIKPENPVTIETVSEVAPGAETTEAIFEFEVGPFLENVLNVLIIIIFTFFIFFILRKMISTIRSSAKDFSDDKEIREVIKLESGKRRFGLFRREPWPNGYNEQIRYLFRRFMEPIQSLMLSDSSEQIVKKGSPDSSESKEFLTIYQNTRYGNQSASESDVNDMKDALKNMKKK